MPQPANSEKQPYYGDLAKTQILNELFQRPQIERNAIWQYTFLENVADASFMCGNPQVFQGPDGFPYFELNIPTPGIPFECFVIRHLKDDFLLEHGLGIVIHPSKSPPDWVFTYGDVVNFHLRNEFYSETDATPMPHQEIIMEEEQVLVGQPSESMLPQQARKVLRDFLQVHGLRDVKLLLMQRQVSGTQELVFNMTPDKFNSEEQYENMMRSVGWFLPRQYTYVTMPESTLAESFSPL